MRQPLPDRNLQLVLAVVLIALTFVHASSAADLSSRSPHTDAVSMASLPINFEPNYGQAAKDARFLARTGAVEIDLNPQGFDLRFADQQRTNLNVTFIGARKDVGVTATEQRPSETNYLVGQDSALWRTHIPNFRRVTYSSLYPGVDAVFYGNGQQLEHDFVVAPGADYHSISMQMRGARQLVLDATGDLRMQLANGELSFHQPIVYQNTARGRRTREGRFILLGHDQVGFAVGNYDHSQPLFIDPVLSYASYLANLFLYVYGVAADSAGNAYVTGLTFSLNYPITPGAFQTTCNTCTSNSPDVFITKFNANGTGQVFSTYLGGSGYDQPTAIAVDANGNVVVTGYTQSTDFPLKNAISHGYVYPAPGCPMGFITSLTPNGSALNYSSILGGGAQLDQSSTTYATALALDASGNAYITGTTDSPVFPVTTGALNWGTPGYPESIAYVSKFSTTGGLVYSALLGNSSIYGGGGAGATGATAINVDTQGNAYLAGSAGSLWPTTSGAYQTQFLLVNNNNDPFVTEVSADGSALLYSTFLGADAAVTGMAVDAAGEVYVTGTGAPSTFPTTTNGFLPTVPAGSSSGFLTELNASGSELLYSTFLLGAANPSGMALDASQDIWLVGKTGSQVFPLVDPIQSIPALNGYSNTQSGFISEFDPTGSSLLFSTYFAGQTGLYSMVGPAFDGSGKLHIAGTSDAYLYTTPGAYLVSVTPPPQYNQYTYGFLAAIDPAVESAALCVVNPANLGISFNYVPTGTTSTQIVTVQNCGTETLTISNVQTSDSAYTVSAGVNYCLTPVPPGGTCSLSVAFAPTQAQSYPAMLSFTSNAAIPQSNLPLQGWGAVPVVYVSSSSVAFGPTLIGVTSPSQQIYVGDNGQAPLTVNLANTTISGPFAFTQSGCNGTLSGPCYINITFTPQSAGTLTGTLTIATNDPVTPLYAVSLSGVGLSTIPPPSVTSVNPPTVAVGSTAVQLSVYGQNFFPNSVINVNGAPLATTYQDSTFLYATLDASAFTTMTELPLTVVSPGPGGGTSNPVTLTLYQSIPMQISTMVYEPFSRLLYAAIPSSATTNPNSVVTIDPLTGNVGAPLAVGDDPEVLALSGDSQYLYVAVNGQHAIQRINLVTSSIEKMFNLPLDPMYGSLSVRDMHVVAGSPQTVVASLYLPDVSPSEDGMAAFNDAGLINWIPGVGNTSGVYLMVDSFAIAGSPPAIYAPPYTSGSTPGFITVTLDSSGLHYTPPGNSSGYPPNMVVSDGTLLYTSAGQVWNPSNQSLVATYTPSYFSGGSIASIIPDDSLGRTFFLNTFQACSDTTGGGVCAFDQNALSLTGALAFPTVFGPELAGLVRWGNDGFALFASDNPSTQSSNQIIIFRSSIAHVTTATNPVPGLTALSSPGAAEGGANFVLGVTGTNFVPGAVVNWNGSARTTSYVSATQVTADIPSTDIASATGAQITVSNPAPGGGTSGALTLTLGASTQVGVNPTSLSFSSQSVGTSSGAQTISVTNSGQAALHITVSSSGDFSQTNTCSTPIGAGANCTISVSFTPTVGGSRTGSITIFDNAPGSPQTVSLSGTGLGPAATLSPTSLSFSNQLVSSTSAPQSVTLNNVGTATLSITSVAASGQFAVSNNCGTGLAGSATCTINVTFSPLQTGSLTGSITITDNAGNSPQTVSLTGVGTEATASLSSLGVYGPEVQVGQTASIGSAVLTNSGNLPLTVTGIVVTGDFAETNNCGSSLAGGNSCTINLTFTPTSEGNQTGSLLVTDNASNSPQQVSLNGVGWAPLVLISPPSLAFSSQPLGSTSGIKSVLLSNTGDAPLSVTSVVAAGDFSQTNTCGASVAAGGACVISVTFSPTATGSRNGSITVTDNATGSPHTVSLTGEVAASALSLSPTSLIFPDTAKGTTSSAQMVTVTNSGTAPLAFTSIGVTGDFAQTNDCGSSLAATSTCTINVTFTPTAGGSRTGAITLTDNAAGSPQIIALAGTGLAPLASLSPTSLTFPAQMSGSTSTAQTITLTDTGNGSLTLSAAPTVSGPFAIAASGTTCSTANPVTAAGSCAVAVTFTPTTGGAASGSLSFSDNTSNSPQSVALSGTGEDFTVAPSSGSPATATVTAGQSATYTLSVGGEGGLTGSVAFTCTGAPSEATCTVSPNPLTVGDSAANVTVTVTTTAASMGLPRAQPLPPAALLSLHRRALWMFGLALVGVVWLIAYRRQPWERRRRFTLALFALGFLAAMAMTACGGGGGNPGGPVSNPGTPAGTYTLTITGTTGSGSSTVSHSTTFKLTVG